MRFLHKRPQPGVLGFQLRNLGILRLDRLGSLFGCLAVITFNRWLDLDPNTSNWVIGVTFRAVGIVALIVALIAAHYAGPALVMRILRGPQDAAGGDS